MPTADALITRLRRQLEAGAKPSEMDLSYLPEGPLVPAAVLVPVVMRPEGPTVLLTQRTAHLRDHAAQHAAIDLRLEHHRALGERLERPADAVNLRLGISDGSMTEVISGDLAENAMVLTGTQAAAAKSAGSPGPRLF